MFWRFGGYANISSIDTILDRPDCTLEKLLDESDVIQELKAQNAKLIEFLREDAVLEKLLKYVVTPKISSPSSSKSPDPESNVSAFSGASRSVVHAAPTEDDHDEDEDDDPEQDEAKRAKYAFHACEILSSEVWSISESLMEATNHLRAFWEYIKFDAPLDNRTATYFSKVNEALLEKKPPEMVAFIKSLDGVVANLMKHVDCPVIMDLLLKLISLEKDPATQGIVDWLQSQNLIPIFLSYITPDHPSSIQTSAGDFLKAIITISANATGQDASVIGPNELTRQLVSEECISTLLSQMLKGGNPLTVGVGIIIEVIRKNNSDYDTDGKIGPEPKSSDPIYLGSLLRLFANHVPKFMELITSQTHTVISDGISVTIERKDLGVAWGGKIEPLGFDRFKTCELMAELLHCSNMGLLNEKGSEADIRRRDAERERLKAEGKLAAEISPQTSADFGSSVDSSGFHHPPAFSALEESPEVVKTLEIHNAADDEEGDEDDEDEEEEEEFEKVTASEAMVDIEDMSTSPDKPSESPKSPKSQQDGTLLVQKAEAASVGNSIPSDSSADTEDQDAKPAPLFSKRPSENANNVDTLPEIHVQEASEAPTHQAESAQEQSDESQPDIQREEDGSPVVGDLLKIMFVEHHVVPTILDFFFRFPWNNFLHNVVYDVVQQVFNGSMDRGYNRTLAIDLFETGRITAQIIQGQKRSDKSQAERKMRLGYMGHLTLIAEEVVKFTERQPTELWAQHLVDKIMDPEWINYVEFTLTETRDRDNAILGGVRPDHALGPRQAVLNAVNANNSSFGGMGSSALANAGLTSSGSGSGGLDTLDLASAGAAGYGLNPSNSFLSGFGGSDDEDEDELEDGQIGEDDSTRDIQQSPEMDENLQSSPPASILPQQPTSDPPPIPAPLAIQPSRARLQLAARLAEKQKRAGTEETSSIDKEGLSESSSGGPEITTSSWSNLRGSSSGDADPFANSNAGAASSSGAGSESEDNDGFPDVESSEDESGGIGFDDNFTGLGGAESESTEGDRDLSTEEEEDEEEEDEDSDDDDTARGIGGLRRQTTKEALERRPLDGDDDSDEDELNSLTLSPHKLHFPAQNKQLQPSPLQQAQPSSPVQQQQQPSRRMSADATAEAKKREQDRLLKRWGFEEEDFNGPSSSSISNTGNATAGAAHKSPTSSASAYRTPAMQAKPNKDDDDDDEDSDDSDEEEAPVTMGSRYLARHRTNS